MGMVARDRWAILFQQRLGATDSSAADKGSQLARSQLTTTAAIKESQLAQGVYHQRKKSVSKKKSVSSKKAN